MTEEEELELAEAEALALSFGPTGSSGDEITDEPPLVGLTETVPHTIHSALAEAGKGGQAQSIPAPQGFDRFKSGFAHGITSGVLEDLSGTKEERQAAYAGPLSESWPAYAGDVLGTGLQFAGLAAATPATGGGALLARVLANPQARSVLLGAIQGGVRGVSEADKTKGVGEMLHRGAETAGVGGIIPGVLGELGGAAKSGYQLARTKGAELASNVGEFLGPQSTLGHMAKKTGEVLRLPRQEPLPSGLPPLERGMANEIEGLGLPDAPSGLELLPRVPQSRGRAGYAVTRPDPVAPVDAAAQAELDRLAIMQRYMDEISSAGGIDDALIGTGVPRNKWRTPARRQEPVIRVEPSPPAPDPSLAPVPKRMATPAELRAVRNNALPEPPPDPELAVTPTGPGRVKPGPYRYDPPEPVVEPSPEPVLELDMRPGEGRSRAGIAPPGTPDPGPLFAGPKHPGSIDEMMAALPEPAAPPARPTGPQTFEGPLQATPDAPPGFAPSEAPFFGEAPPEWNQALDKALANYSRKTGRDITDLPRLLETPYNALTDEEILAKRAFLESWSGRRIPGPSASWEHGAIRKIYDKRHGLMREDPQARQVVYEQGGEFDQSARAQEGGVLEKSRKGRKFAGLSDDLSGLPEGVKDTWLKLRQDASLLPDPNFADVGGKYPGQPPPKLTMEQMQSFIDSRTIPVYDRPALKRPSAWRLEENERFITGTNEPGSYRIDMAAEAQKWRHRAGGFAVLGIAQDDDAQKAASKIMRDPNALVSMASLQGSLAPVGKWAADTLQALQNGGNVKARVHLLSAMPEFRELLAAENGQ